MKTSLSFFQILQNHTLRYKEKCASSCWRQLLRLAGMSIKYPHLSATRGILKFMIGLTYDCQCQCNYCCAGLYTKGGERELSAEEIKALVEDIRQLPSLLTLVSFFGGEPLLRDDIVYLIENTAKKGLFTEMETNGILLSLEKVRRLKKAGLHHIFVRVESSDPVRHDNISDFKGCFKYAIEGIKYCVSERLSCSISTIATKEKIYNREIEDIINLGKKLKVASVRILHPTLAGKWLKEDKQLLTDTEKNKVKELLTPNFVYLESSYVCSREFERICPAQQKKLIYISCYGEVQPCPFVPIVFGNIRSEKIGKILDKMWKDFIFFEGSGNGCLADKSCLGDKNFD